MHWAVIGKNSDWFIALFSLVVIGRSDYFGIAFSTIIWKPLSRIEVAMAIILIIAVVIIIIITTLFACTTEIKNIYMNANRVPTGKNLILI